MINEKYSYKDFTGQDLSDHDPAGFSGMIVGSCFAHENSEGMKPKLHVVFPRGAFPDFERCNLDNVVIPRGSKLFDCSHRMLKYESDGDDWVQDENWNPKEPHSIKQNLHDGKSINPLSLRKVGR